MTSYVSADLRRLVEDRAGHRCEYCLIRESDTYLGCQVDHIIAEKHGGETTAENLSLACTFCNRAKGSDIGSIAASTGELTRFFNPRSDRWSDHFQLSGNRIEPLTPVGEATERVFGFNTADRLVERESLQSIGFFPTDEEVGG
jgi:hypothetical protein